MCELVVSLKYSVLSNVPLIARPFARPVTFVLKYLRFDDALNAVLKVCW